MVNKKKKKLIYEEYFDFQNLYENKFKQDTIVLMEVGKFYEIYGIDNQEGKVKEVCNILNIRVAHKDKDKGDKFYLFAGFPIWSKDKFIQMLLDNNYIVVLVDQEKTGATKNLQRAVSNILTPSINLEYIRNKENNYILCCYLESSKSKFNEEENLYCGLSLIDITTGKNLIYEFGSNVRDNKCLDEIFRFIQIYQPNEIVIYNKSSMLEKNLNKYLQLYQYNYKHIGNLDEIYLNLEYQKKTLNKIFQNENMIDIFSFLEFDNLSFAIVSYILLINFVHRFDENILENIDKPKIYKDDNKLILTTNSVVQLDIINNKKEKSVFDLVNNTSTNMGYRLLKNNLLNPIIDHLELETRYKGIQDMMIENNYLVYEEYLNKINDIERIQRKQSVNKIMPSDYSILDLAFKNILNIDKTLIKKHKISNILFDKSDIVHLKQYMKEYSEYFDIDNIHKFNKSEPTEDSFIKLGKSDKLDKAVMEITEIKKYFNDIAQSLSIIIDKNSNNLVKLCSTDKDGYYLTTTKSRWKILEKKEELKDVYPDYRCRVQSTNVKLENSLMREKSSRLIILCDKIKTIQFELFYKLIKKFYTKYHTSIMNIINIVSQLDVIKSNCKTAKKYRYYKPNLDMTADSSYISVKNIRHPLIENILSDIPYIGNDFELGTSDQKGILLFGVNAVGKSSLMKSAGICVILAQAGMYVPANMTYKPYKYLFTRILGNDNLYKGQSSFAVEMCELRAILNHATDNSLVLGDELCSGTESISAYSIISAGVLWLERKKSSFIFATHCHDLVNEKRINSLKSINFYHLAVKYNQTLKTLEYTRKLQEGSGSAIYGLEVCRAMDLNSEFLELANTIRNEYTGRSENIINTQKSNYNKKVFMDKCELCKINNSEETHHIEEQHLADIEGFIGYQKKNKKSNLVPLCKQCHLQITLGKIQMGPKIMSSKGIMSKTVISCSKNISNKKFNDDQIKHIKLWKDDKMSIVLIQNKVFEVFNKKISKSTISKIINNKY